MWKCPYCGQIEPLCFQRSHIKYCLLTPKKKEGK